MRTTDGGRYHISIYRGEAQFEYNAIYYNNIIVFVRANRSMIRGDTVARINAHI